MVVEVEEVLLVEVVAVAVAAVVIGWTTCMIASTVARARTMGLTKAANHWSVKKASSRATVMAARKKGSVTILPTSTATTNE